MRSEFGQVVPVYALEPQAADEAENENSSRGRTEKEYLKKEMGKPGLLEIHENSQSNQVRI